MRALCALSGCPPLLLSSSHRLVSPLVRCALSFPAFRQGLNSEVRSGAGGLRQPFCRIGVPSRRAAGVVAMAAADSAPAQPPIEVVAMAATDSAPAQAPIEVFAMAATDSVPAEAPIEVFVKAAVGRPDKLGDCPFSQRVLMTLEQKAVPYDAKLIDTSNKPQWFLEVNPEGKVPVIKYEGKFVADSDVITQLLEEKFPEPSLKTPEDKVNVGGKVFPKFVAFLKSKDSSDGTEGELLTELEALDEHLKLNKPFIAGDKVTAVDLALAPKLYHLKIALGHYKKWSVPEQMTNLRSYIEAVHSLESFKRTQAEEEYIIAGWAKLF